MAQNLVSGALTPEEQNDILTSVETLRGKMPFLTGLSAEERRYLLKAGNLYSSFITRAVTTVEQNPGIMAALFDKEEYLRDGELLRALTPIHMELQKLFEALDDTVMALKSDLFNASLEVYQAVRLNKDKVAGLDAVEAEMKTYFKRSRKTPPPSA